MHSQSIAAGGGAPNTATPTPALDMLDDSFPHSTRAGYDAGCRGNHCRGREDNGITCSELVIRYASDWSFRKRIDAGMAAPQIVAEDAEQAAAAQRRAATPRKRSEPRAPRPARASKRTAEQVEAARLAREARAGATARRIEREAAREAKVELALIKHGFTDAERDALRAERAEWRAHITDNRRVIPIEEVRKWYALDKLDAEIGELIGMSSAYVTSVRCRENMPVLPHAQAPTYKQKRTAVHGTASRYAGGCRKREDCPNFGTTEQTCPDANNEYCRTDARLARAAARAAAESAR